MLGVEAPKTRGDKATHELLGGLRLEIERRLKDLPEESHMQCTQCWEIATSDTEACPYCGFAGEETEEEAAKAAKFAAEQLKKLRRPVSVVEPDEPEEDTDEDASDDESEDDADEDQTAAAEEEESDGDEEDSDEEDADDADEDGDEEEADEEDEPEEPAKPVKVAKAPKPKVPAKVPAKKVKAESVGISPSGGAIVKNVDAALTEQSQELDAAIARIVKAKREFVGLHYSVGVELRGIRDKQLFKARGYSSFKAFAEKELPIARESALQLIALVEKYSREDYDQIGYTKLRTLSAVTDTVAKEEILEAARKGASTSEVKRKVEEQKVKLAASGGKAAKEKAAPEKGPRITLLGSIGARAQIVRFNDADTGEQVDSVGVFSAKALKKNVYGEFEISDGVYVRIGIRVTAKNELEGLTLRFVRASDDV